MAAPEKRTSIHENVSGEPEPVREHLERILASRTFGHAESLVRLLSYLVEETLGGRSECLKEYTLGVEVFRRGADFDPRVDTIVRTQARRLRAKLEDYYSEEGATDGIVIEIPKGTYVPSFARRTHAVPQHETGQSGSDGPAIPLTNPESCICVPVSVQRPVRTVGILAGAAALIILTALAIQRSVGTSLAVSRPSVAVLPFADFGQTVAQTNLGEGISDEISQALSRIAALRVVSRTSTLQFKGAGADLRKVGADLGVAAVVEGSVRSLGDRMRITAHLVNAEDGYRLWSRSWEASPEGMDKVQEEAARGIASALGITLAPAEQRKQSPEAYRLYLKGRFGPDPDESISWLDGALKIDPRFAAAWMAKAEIYMYQTRRALAAPVEVLPKAREAALRSIQLGQDTAAAHLVLGGVAAIHDWQWDRAEQEYRRALEMEPDNGFARLHYAHLLGYRGRMAEALEQIERIGAIDSKATALPAGQAALFYLSRQYDRVLDYCNTVLAAAPDAPDCHYWSGRAWLSKGMTDQAVAALEKRQPLGGMGFGFPVTAYLAAGRRSDAQRLRAQVEKLKQRAYVSPVSLAQMHFAFKEWDEGFRQLERALELRDQSLPGLKAEPAYDAIRGDARFQRIVEKLRL